jgi:hypothetical protein
LNYSIQTPSVLRTPPSTKEAYREKFPLVEGEKTIKKKKGEFMTSLTMLSLEILLQLASDDLEIDFSEICSGNEKILRKLSKNSEPRKKLPNDTKLLNEFINSLNEKKALKK